MASLCKKQQCTIERRGFRQELDSWRHKLIHCVGFESILEGLFGQGLVEDLTLFKDCEPEGVSDWSFDENCVFCCLRRAKVKEHLFGLSDQVPESFCKQEQAKINRLEKRVEEFLNAVIYRKGSPSFSEPNIPLVAREIMQRMVRQFAAEYTSKTGSSQDPLQPNGPKDQSLPEAPSPSPPPPPAAPAQNPVLSRLLMADQDSPLDLTVKRSNDVPRNQDGVLDLSTKSRIAGNTSHKNSHGCGTGHTVKGDLSPEKARDLQSTATLEQFMSKLCLHHQQQIVDALGFLQTEVQAVASSCSPLSSGAKESPQAGLKTISGPEERAELPAFGQSSTPPPSKGNQSTEGPGLANSNCLVPEQSAEAADPADAPAGSPCPTRSDPLDIWGASQCCGSLTPAMKENANTSNLIEVKNLPGTPKSPGHPAVGALEELQYNTKTFSPPNIADPGLAGLKSSSTKHDQVPDPFLPGQKNTPENTKDSWVRPLAAKKTTKTPSPRKARKSRNGSSPQPKESVCRTISDPDSHYDIVYISKPITECERKPQNRMFPRRNARKSTRGHMYIKECWELKTVRTLARNSGGSAEGNCPAPMPQTIAPVTPKQALSKPDGVPSLDMPFALGCEEAVGQQGPLEDSVVEEIVAAFSEPDSKVETSQTGMPHTTKQASPPHEVLVPLVELQHKESEEVEDSRLVKEALSKNVAKPSLPKGGGEEVNPGRESVKEVIATVQPQDVLSDVTVAAVGKSKRETVLAEDDQNDAYENQPRLKSPSLVTAAEDFVLSENVAVVGESRKDDRPLECPRMEDVLGSAEVETHLFCKDGLEKEMIEKMEAQRTDPGCQATADNEVSQTMEADLSVKEAAQPSATDSNLEHAEMERMQEEAVVSAPGSISTKKRSSVDLVVSDRCLRSRAQPSPSEPVRLPKTFRKLPDSLAVPDVQVNGMESSVPKHSHGLDQVDKAGAAGPLAEFDPNAAQQGSGGFTDKPQLFSDARPRGSGAESMVQTRQKHKSTMAKDPEKAVGLLGDCEGFPCTAGTASERDKLKTRKSPHEQRAILPKREARAANGASSTSRGIAMETSRKMPVRRDGRNVGTGAKPMSSSALMRHKKLVLRSQRPTTHKRHGQNRVDCRRKAAAERCEQARERESDPLGLQKLDVLGPKPPKFLQALKGEENQQLITNLNNRYDKMQKGWIPLDKAGQPIQRSKNKADRLKEIWKSKRRVRKPRSLDQQKYSPVHMLFMKTFDLTSICHWFLQTTETKSLVIVKKVNTRLPSETQLCFHGPSGVGGSSHGVFPSLQAERLKKHLKKFAIASPVKSNPKNQRLIAKAWAQEGSCSKGKDKEKALTTATRISTKPYGHPHEPQPQPGESQKAAGSTKMPATARILRKYSNIREKLQVQQRTLKPKEASRADLRAKPLTSTRPISRPKSSSELRKKTSPSGKISGAKRLKTQPNPSSKRVAVRTSAKEKRKVNGSRKPSAVLNKKDPLPKRSSPSTSSLKRPKAAAAASSRCLAAPSSLKSRAEARPKESKKVATEEAKPVPVQPREAEEQLKKSAVRSKASESEASQLHKVDVAPSVSQDQVLTRSQRKIEASSVTVSTLATVASKSTAKRSLDLIQTPAKRTRASFLK